MRENLGVSGMRRVLADLIDVGIAIAIAAGLYHAGVSPWYSLGYFLVRDCIPPGRSIGKLATGVHVRDAGSLGPSTFLQRLIRGITTIAILVPLGLLIAAFMAVFFGVLAVAGVIVIIWGGRSFFLKMIGYDFATGRTIPDQIARTHLVTLSDLEVLSASARKLESLRSDLPNRQTEDLPR